MSPGGGPDGQSVPGGLSLFIGAGLAGYALLLFTNPVFPSLLNGLRVLRRHPRVWVWFGALSGLYFLFQSFQAHEIGSLQFGVADLLYWPAFTPGNAGSAAAKAWLPALDGLAGLFEQAVATFPASALAAFLFLVNWRAVRSDLRRATQKRFKRWWPAVYALVALCAFAALLKPAFAAGIYLLNRFVGAVDLLRWGALLDLFSFQFEALFGMWVQVYLILVVYTWQRGLSASADRVFALAVARGVFAVRWTGALLVAGLILVHLPLLVTYAWIQVHTDYTKAVVQYVDQTARPLLDLTLILFASVQLNLVFHNETLSQALRAHGAFVRAHWGRLLWFLLVAGVHFFFVEWFRNYLVAGFPEDSVPERLAQLVLLEAKAFLSAWFLSAWVCLYRAAQEGAPGVLF